MADRHHRSDIAGSLPQKLREIPGGVVADRPPRGDAGDERLRLGDRTGIFIALIVISFFSQLDSTVVEKKKREKANYGAMDHTCARNTQSSDVGLGGTRAGAPAHGRMPVAIGVVMPVRGSSQWKL